MDIYMNNANVNVGNGPEGQKMLEIIDPGSSIKVVVILPAASARKIAGALHGITLASALPDNGKGE